MLKSLSSVISNKKIDQLYSHFMNNGAIGGKLGAGGGGFMLFCIPPHKTKKFVKKLKILKLYHSNLQIQDPK